MVYDELDQREPEADDRLPRVRHYLRQWRERKKLTQAKLAEMAGTTASVVSLIETGERGLRDIWVYKFAAALRIRPGYLFDVNPFKANTRTDIIESVAEITDESQVQLWEIVKTFPRKPDLPNKPSLEFEKPRVTVLKHEQRRRGETTSKPTEESEAGRGGESPQGI